MIESSFDESFKNKLNLFTYGFNKAQQPSEIKFVYQVLNPEELNEEEVQEREIRK